MASGHDSFTRRRADARTSHSGAAVTDIVERLKRKTRRHILASTPPEATFLENMDLSELLIEYRTWRGQFVAPLPRRVHRSKGLRKAELPAGQRQALEEMAERIEAGEDLTANLSSAVQRVPRPGRRGATRRDTSSPTGASTTSTSHRGPTAGVSASGPTMCSSQSSSLMMPT